MWSLLTFNQESLVLYEGECGTHLATELSAFHQNAATDVLTETVHVAAKSSTRFRFRHENYNPTYTNINCENMSMNLVRASWKHYSTRFGVLYNIAVAILCI